jgi:hypothetical protein
MSGTSEQRPREEEEQQQEDGGESCADEEEEQQQESSSSTEEDLEREEALAIDDSDGKVRCEEAGTHTDRDARLQQTNNHILRDLSSMFPSHIVAAWLQNPASPLSGGAA